MIPNQAILATLGYTEYPTATNIFLTDFINKIVMTKVNERIWANPLNLFFKGKIQFGASIEQAFVHDAEQKFFGENFTGSTSTEGNVMGKTITQVDVVYLTQNYMNKIKTSVSKKQLAAAFQSENGLYNLANRLIQSIYSKYEKTMYMYVLHIIENLAGAASETGSTNTMFIKVKDGAPGIDDDVTARKVLKKIKALASRLTYPSGNFSLSGITEVFSQKEDLVVLTTPENSASIDVDALAAAFQIDRATMNLRTIIVDRLPKMTAEFTPIFADKIADPETGLAVTTPASYTVDASLVGAQVEAVIIDLNAVQMYETLKEQNEFFNPDSLTTNFFLHFFGIASANPFEQCVFLYSK